MSAREKKICPIRFYEDDYKKIKAKAYDDNVNFQKLGEILFGAYLKNNKEIKKLVSKYAEDKERNRARYVLNEVERNEILRKIEQDYSPLRDIESVENIMEEIEQNEE